MQEVKTTQSASRQIFKNTALFSGVQVYNIFISLVRSKFVAIYLGPAGMGVANLLSSPLTVISTISGLGLTSSAVRDISEANSNNDLSKIGRTIYIVRKWFVFTGLLGAFITLIMAPLLSKWSFNNYDYTWSFMWLSVTMFLGALSNGQSTLLRGMRRISYIVKSSLIGSILGLITTVPLYYFMGAKGIVPAIIISSISTLILSWYYSSKVEIVPVKTTIKETIAEGSDMAKLGLLLVISTFIGTLTKYITNIYIGHVGNIADVGLYTAAISISGQYIGFVLSSMSADYFPRLAAVNTDIAKTNETVNKQSEIVLLIASPLLILMILSSPLLIKFLLSSKFYVITNFIRYVAIGSFFQVTSYCMGYIAFAKKDKVAFLVLEGFVGNFLLLFLNMASYYIWGLQGLAISFAIMYLLYFIIIFIFTRIRYKYIMSSSVIKIFMVMFILITASLSILLALNNIYGYVISGLLFLVSAVFAYIELDKLIGLKQVGIKIKQKLTRRKK